MTTLTLKLHQLIQAIDFALEFDDEQVANDDGLEVKLTFKELPDGVYVWKANDPKAGSSLLSDEAPEHLTAVNIQQHDADLEADEQTYFDFTGAEAKAEPSSPDYDHLYFDLHA